MEKINPIEFEASQDNATSQRLAMMHQLAGGIAHDFNNLLMVIQGNLDLLNKQHSSDATSARRINAAIKAAKNASNLTKRLMAFAKTQSLNQTLIQLKNYLTEFVERIQPTLIQPIQLRTEFDESIWNLNADLTQLENALLNLIINAQDALSGKVNLHIKIIAANVTLSTENLCENSHIVPGDYVRISVIDNGSGMPPHVLQRAFEPFFTTKSQGKGTGLGLSMVYGFVQQSKGFMTLQSEISQGTTVSIYLPKATLEAKLEAPETEQPELNNRNETILVVEDQKDLLDLTTDYLSSLGYKTLSALSAHNALDLLKQNKIDLLFSDIIMPGFLSGTQLANEAQRIQPDIKVLLTTGYPKSALKGKDLPRYHDLVLTKPYNIRDLNFKIREILDSSAVY